VVDNGRAAVTDFRVVERWAQATALEVTLRTGRTHQIRVHLAHLRHPVLGDDKYGDFELNKRLRREGLHRMFLHAARLAFTHPQTGAPVVVESPLPADLEAFRMRHLAQEPG
jgi:23S rRNA pseudouridine955/2504/2580 synthase